MRASSAIAMTVSDDEVAAESGGEEEEEEDEEEEGDCMRDSSQLAPTQFNVSVSTCDSAGDDKEAVRGT